MNPPTDCEPLVKKLKVETSCNTPASASLSTSASSYQISTNGASHSSINAMDLKPKNGAGSPHGAKQKQQKKLKNTLDCWLTKPQKSANSENKATSK
ncbi:hypothetical protein WMY93_009872 [Mugilogobius chulae]|uniref:Uncharacterized protein n=1 Tax=Mugilogobius chulae TaxID=88201 RepID=A0AAW0PI31_9GOBI